MSDKMTRFLASLGITNPEEFDLEFDYINKNRFNEKQWDFGIVKSTPWTYPLLRKFQDGLDKINYPYTIRFSYASKPSVLDVIILFQEWYQSIYFVAQKINMSESDGSLLIQYNSEEEYNCLDMAITDFKDFLKFICYDIKIIEKVNEVEEIKESTSIGDAEQEKIIEHAKEELKELKEEGEVNDSEEAANKAAEEHKELTNQVEEAFLNVMRENRRLMEIERERARLNKRGNYEPIEKIDDITQMSDHVDFSGEVFHIEENDYAGKKRLNIGVNDEFGGAIYVSLSANEAFLKNTYPLMSRGSNVRVRGVAYIDNFTHALQIRGHFVDLLPPDEIQPENFEQNRVELHLHCNMSNMDGVSKMEEYCAYAKALGHKTLSVTDHAVAQGFPMAQKAAKKAGLKMIYGCELYMVDDQQVYIQNPCKTPLKDAKYVLLDLETTGLSSFYNRIIEFGAVTVEKGSIVSSVDWLINPGIPIPPKITELTDISDDMVKDCPTIEEVLPKIIEYCKDAILVTHNASFDISFLQENLKRLGYEELKNPIIDTLALSRYLFPDSRRHSLGAVCRNLEVEYDEDSAHRADYDATVLNDAFQAMLAKLTKHNLHLTHEELGNLETPVALLKHIKPHHVICLVKNLKGLKSLYELISLGHVDYLADVPKVPRREIEKRRENLLIGSACFNGEIFDTARYYNRDRIKQAMSFYDYIEIQPLANYSHLVNMQDLTWDEVKTLVLDIVECADELGKKVVATSDCHYVTRKQKIFRDVYINALGIGKTVHPLNPYSRARLPRFENPDQHYRTTQEMLDEMAFLGEEKAKEITITNTNLIADSIESIVPVPNNKLFVPKIPGLDVAATLKEMVMNKAHELYGDPLPELIQKRLDRELSGIIDNGYAVIYYLAHKIVNKTNEDGYIVGSRGSVGSSFVATMAGITEVNPLPPHYRCPHCKHIEWTSESMPNYLSGYDLPNKKCPVCGEEMVHDGQNIPFETFLGFNADKTPDIDLNFPSDYQARAHEYTKVLLGENNVFRAGTIETVADKTAFGFAKGYLERTGADLSVVPKAKIDYLAYGCVDVKRTTGQHPGGIVCIPRENDVCDFTPFQYPADEPDSAWKTTHLEYHSMDETLLKLDMLGHVDPLALKMMSELAHVDIKSIPMNDKRVISLFSSPVELDMDNDYTNAETGALAIPEFGTEFVRGVLEDTRPTSFADLVIISGITHGTDVWQGNIETLIKQGVAPLRGVIGCRDDIMTYLISKGVEPIVAFTIMEKVRHGKGLTEEHEAIMKANKVPDYYIQSCKKIQYLFPKGHAVAYVTMAVRVGYFKIYYPLEFYATFFSARSKQYDIEPMIKGRGAVIARLDELKLKSKSRNKEDKLTTKESEQIKTLNVALEMLQRGYTFSNIDLYKSDSSNFVVDRENKCLIPPFATVDNLGENNAISVIEERKLREFTSIEDLSKRTKLTQTNIDDLKRMGVLDNIPETDQISLFDF